MRCVHPEWPIYGLDIESDTTVDGLDPAHSSVLAVAVATSGGTTVLHASDTGEAEMLWQLDALLQSLAPGVSATWNGGRFDLPFLADRAAVGNVTWSLRLSADPHVGSRDPMPGHDGGYVASWGAHRHLDGYQLYRGDVGRVLPISCGLKSIARFVGLRPIEVDRTAIHQLSRADLDAYVGSDAELARTLVARRLPASLRHVDPVVLTDQAASNSVQVVDDTVLAPSAAAPCTTR